VGLNGMGKTNLLDAIHYMCMTKSNFVNSDRDVVRHGESFLRLEGHFLNKKKEKIVAKVIPGTSKIFEKNDIPYHKLSEHIGLLPLVVVAPDDTALAREGSEERRRFIDNTLSQGDQTYLKNLIFYNRVLKQRNSLLKEGASKGYLNVDLLKTYNQQLFEPAAFIFEKRKALLEILTPIFNEFYQKISGQQEKVSCVYSSQLLKDSLENLLLANYEKDRILQRTTCGIHKDNLIFKINNREVKKFASQGQLKSYVLALKLTQYELLRQFKGFSPILLLDDLFDKLDAQRVQHLIELLMSDNFGQIFISDTDKDRVEKIVRNFGTEYRKFVVENGAIV
jgi:DNA replication and repair protein RecF